MKGKLCGVEVNFLIDSGASDSFLNLAEYERLAGLGLPQLRELTGPAELADGSPLRVKGYLKGRITVGKMASAGNVIVADVSAPAILGLDFLLATRSTIDLEGMTIGNRKHREPLRDQGGVPIIRQVHVSETVMVPAGSEKMLLGDVEHQDGEPWMESAILEQTLNQRQPNMGIMLARVVVTGQKQVPMRVFNPGADPVLLYKGTTIGRLIPLRREDIVEHAEGTVTNCRIQMGSSSAEQPVGVPEHLQDLFQRSKEHLTEVQGLKVAELLNRYSDVFTKNDMDMGQTDMVKHSIKTGDTSAIRQPFRRLPVVQQQEAERQVTEMLERGIIEKSQSPWASPIVLAKKKDGSTRFCVDYRRLNNVTVKDAYPLPRIDDTLDALSEASWFSTMDLANGYWQVALDEEAKEKSAFRVRGGLYQWNVMPFGLCNAPSTFERLMERVLEGLHWKILLVYLDDIIIYGKTFGEELDRIEAVFQRLRKAKLKLKPKKCHLFCKQVGFLGHVVSEEGVATDPEKIEAVKAWPTPTSVTEVRSFVGLASYYRRFIKGFAVVARPLHKLMEKEERFRWTKECGESFAELKKRLVSAPILGYPRLQGKYILDTDASGYGIGAVLSQEQDGQERVIAYGSRTLSKAERNYCVTRRELLAVVVFVKKFRQFLLGREFDIRTDHGSLRWLVTFKDPEGQLARWHEVLGEYQYNVIHRAGRVHGNADGLSRRPCVQCGRLEPLNIPVVPQKEVRGEAEKFASGPGEPGGSRVRVGTILMTPQLDLADVREAQLGDHTIRRVMVALESGAQPDWKEASGWRPAAKAYLGQWGQLRVRDGVMCRRWQSSDGRSGRWQLVVPCALRGKIVRDIHGGRAGAHLGMKKTLGKVVEHYYWVGHTADVRSWCRTCEVCGARGVAGRKPRAGLRQYPVGGPMERVAMDIMGPFPESQRGNRVILVLADYFTKWAEAFPLPNQEASTIAEKLVEEVVCRFGVPRELHSDQGTNFESNLMAEVCRLLGIHKTRTTPYNPKSDGLVERMNRTLLDMMAKMIEPAQGQRDWDQVIPYALMAYRSAIQESTGETPNMMMLGRETRLPAHMRVPPPGEGEQEKGDYALGLRGRLQDAWERAARNLESSAARQKEYYNRKLFGSPHKPGQAVWLYKSRRKSGVSPKLASRWEGPYLVTDRLAVVTYRIQKGPRGRPKVVHFDRLKPYSSTLPSGWARWRAALEDGVAGEMTGASAVAGGSTAAAVGEEVGGRLCDGESAGGGAVDEGRSRSGDGVGRAEPLGPAGADCAGECGSVVQVPTLAAGGGSHPPAARPEAVETSVAEGGGRKRVLPRWLEGYELGR